MADAKGMCDECGKTRVLQERIVNQELTRMLCARCLDEDSAVRSARAVGVAGRPPKRESQLENVVWRIVLSEAQSKRFEAWLAKQGHVGGRNPALKRFAKSV